MFNSLRWLFSTGIKGAFILALALGSLASSVFAADGAIHPPADYSGALGKLLLGLLLVLALIAALTYLLKRLPGSGAASGAIALIASLPLGSRERLLLVAIGDEQILLASSSAGIALLHVLQKPLPKTSASKESAFAAQLAHYLPSLQRGRA